jgi:hypothetical protein
MNRKIYSGIVVAIVCLTFGLLTGCSSSSSPTLAISATGGTPQTQTVGEAFSTALAVNVTSNGAPATGVTVTFAPPSSGQSCTPSATTATTDSNGNASITCTANTTPGSYSVSASASSTASTTFSLTNQAPSVFVYSVNGLEEINDGPNYYAIAGAVSFDLSGNVLGGEQDYNDGNGNTSPGEPTTPDTITATGSSLTVDTTTGTGILVLVSSNTNVGPAATPGTETFTIQFANSSHGVISQFDGSATSSGSFDLQGSTTIISNFAFTLSGTDSNYDGMAMGGVFSDTAGVISGTVDVNDDETVTTGTEGTANLSGTDNGITTGDVYGRGTATISTAALNSGTAISLAYYVAGPEVIRLIDVDATDSAVGTAFGQGATPAFDSTALGTVDVFGHNGNPWGELYASAGQLTLTGSAGVAAGTFTGEADIDEGASVVESGSGISGTYTINPDGYGSLSITSANLGDSTTLGVYATDPTLNLYDFNSTTTGTTGGALVLELDSALWGGSGIVTTQGTISSTGSDINNSYAFGAQDYWDNGTGWEFDMNGQGTFTALVLAGTGDISDPWGYFVTGGGEFGSPTPVPFAGTAGTPDTFGRYTYSTALAIGPVGTNTAANTFPTAVMYEANSNFVFWIDTDGESTVITPSLWLGGLEIQSSSSLAKSHFKKGVVSRAQTKTSHR